MPVSNALVIPCIFYGLFVPSLLAHAIKTKHAMCWLYYEVGKFMKIKKSHNDLDLLFFLVVILSYRLY